MQLYNGEELLNQIKQYEKPESTGDMPNNWELPNKEQKLIRTLQRGNGDTEYVVRELMDAYDWGQAKIKRVLKNSPGVVP